MTKITFTDKKLKELPIKETRYAVQDDKQDGLELFVHPKGTKTFCFYKRVNNIPKHQKIGKLGEISTAQARNIVAALLNKLNENPYISKNAKVGKLLMKNVFQMYMNSKINLSSKTINEYSRLWNSCLCGYMGNMPAYQVSMEFIEDLRTRLSKTPYQANRCITLLKTLFNYLIDKKGYEGKNPANGVDCFPEEPLIRALSPNEMEVIIRTLNRLQHKQFRISYYAILCLALIPVRKSALLSMRWQDLSLSEKRWIVPESKNKKNLRVNLPNAIIPILNHLKRHAQQDNINSPYVFYSPKNSEKHLVEIKKTWEQIKQLSNIEGRVRLHDFRHSYATLMAELNGSPYQIKVALGHNSLKSGEVYVNLAQEHISQMTNQTVHTMLQPLIPPKLERPMDENDIIDMLLQGEDSEPHLDYTKYSFEEIGKIQKQQKKKDGTPSS
jgi:integrase